MNAAATPPGTLGRAVMATAWLGTTVLIIIVLVFASIRAATDLPHLLTGQSPGPDTFEARYVATPWLAYLHIIPGVLYLVGAPVQLWRRFRERHFNVHRVMGRIILPAGVVSGVFALAFGVPFSFGGAFQSLATAVFGSWFVLCLLFAYAAIRRRDTRMHRRWMIRAFAVGIGVGTIRLWVGTLTSLTDIPAVDSFALAFWLGLSMNVLAGELWLIWRPLTRPQDRPRVAPDKAATRFANRSHGMGSARPSDEWNDNMQISELLFPHLRADHDRRVAERLERERVVRERLSELSPRPAHPDEDSTRRSAGPEADAADDNPA